MSRKHVEIKVNRCKRLKELCNEPNMSQAKLSGIINLSQQTISKIINEKANLTEDTARIIAAKLRERRFPNAKYTFEYLMAYDMEPQLYENPLEFEKDWIRQGGGAHPLNNPIVVEARIGVALEKLNENGWRVAVNMIESLCSIPEFQAKEENRNEM